jgi:hypothetical protein
MVPFVRSAVSRVMRFRRIGAGGRLVAAGLLLAGVAGATLADPARIVLEDFARGTAGEFPPGWNWRAKDDGKRKLYVLREENGRRYLNARDDSQSVLIVKKVSWKLRDYPVLTWRWRVRTLPVNADERLTPRNDSAAGLYVVFSQNWLGIPKQIKYVWSTTLPVGTVADRRMVGRPRVLVLRSGASRLGEWVTERVNLYDDYRRIWGGEPDEKTVGIAILTDADATRSYAEADYADIVVSAK